MEVSSYTRILAFSLFTFITFLTQPNILYSNELKQFDIMRFGFESEKKLLSFSKKIDEYCKDKKFFQNLKKHKSYPKFGSTSDWLRFCEEKKKNKVNTLKFIKNNLNLISNDYKKSILTGYYSPEIKISRTKSPRFRYPILKKSDTLLVERKKIIETFKQEDVLFWADDKIELFFLQIQGSGVGVLENNKKVKLNYGGNNGFEYTSIGKLLIKNQFIKKNNVTAQSIKNWLAKNPNLVDEIFNKNKRYIFFKAGEFDYKMPKGASGHFLEPKTSIAIDKNIYPYGIPFILLTDKKDYVSLVVSDDTGSAIKGANRADLFLGDGLKAGLEAGKLKETLKLIVLTPK